MAGIILFFMACVQEDIEILAMEWAIFTHELLFQPRDFWFNNYFGIDCKIGQNVVFNNLKSFKCGIIGNGDSRSSSRICSSVNYHQYGYVPAAMHIMLPFAFNSCVHLFLYLIIFCTI
ncbi:uncharacterized protein LOC107829457 isoform X2 [Nicotiana tabacum]|uniref:Uncharacterized protein LOC107829457 isoform X2 n=1 Tax=Nicotiana tabacum TaxID=4097 RepID=A0AC58S392_TOBAC